MSNTSDNRRWELIFKEVNKTITAEEQVELDALQKDVFEKRKVKPSKKGRPLIDAESY